MMTQEELAEKIHVSKSAIAKWETDGGIPDRDNLFKLSEILGVPVQELHHIISNNKYSDICFDVNITKDIIAVFESYGYTVVKKEEKSFPRREGSDLLRKIKED